MSTVEHKFKIYVAIDFGTDGTGLAYCLPNATTQKIHIHNKWKRWNSSKQYESEWDEISKIKPKTAILLDKDGKFRAFGDNAIKIYLLLKDNTMMLFEHFKMHLYNKPHYVDDDEKKQNTQVHFNQYLTAKNGKQYKSSLVFIEALKHLKKEAFHVFTLNKLGIKNNKDVCWILTVPAIWDDIAKAKMRKWAIAAGMVDPNVRNNLLLRYEPDCASLSIQFDMNNNEKTVANFISNPTDGSIEDTNDDEKVNYKKYQKKLRKNDKYILVDAGSGTVDIACHQILDKNNSVRELLHPSGGPWGDMYIDTYFMQILYKIFDKKWIEDFNHDEPNSYLTLLENFRRAKWNFEEFHDTDGHYVTLPVEFVEYIEEKLQKSDRQLKDIEKVVDKFVFHGEKHCFKLDADQFKMNYKIWKQYLFDLLMEPIIKQCKKLLSHEKMKNCKYLCIVGGFGAIAYFQKRVKATFGKKSKYKLDVIIPKRPMLSVLDGAARMAMKKDYVKERVLAKTYGDFCKSRLQPHTYEKLPKKWREKNEMAKYEDGSIRFKNVFARYAKQNACIKINDKPITVSFERTYAEQKRIPFNIYSSNEEDPKYFEENDKKRFTALVEDWLYFPDDTDELYADFDVYFGENELSIWGQVRGRPETKKELRVNCQFK
eukprot:321527_1